MKDLFSKYKIFHINPRKLRSKNFYKDFVINERKKFWEKRKKLNKTDSNTCCFLCNNKQNNKLFLDHNEYKLFKCNNCSLIFANIHVEDNYTDIVYDNTQYEEMIKKEVIDTYEYRKNTFGKERLNYIQENCTFNKEEDTLLDIGCGPGYFLSYLKDNSINAEGIELTEYLVEICKSNHLNVQRKELQYTKDNFFQVITMFDVLEHLSNPIDFFSTLNNKMKKGAYAVMYTPNINSFSFYFQKGNQNLLLPYEHLCFYNNKSLEYLSNQCGFEIVKVEYFGLDIVDYLAMKEYEDDISYNDKLKEIIPYIQALIDKHDLANHMRIILKKV